MRPGDSLNEDWWSMRMQYKFCRRFFRSNRCYFIFMPSIVDALVSFCALRTEVCDILFLDFRFVDLTAGALSCPVCPGGPVFGHPDLIAEHIQGRRLCALRGIKAQVAILPCCHIKAHWRHLGAIQASSGSNCILENISLYRYLCSSENAIAETWMFDLSSTILAGMPPH